MEQGIPNQNSPQDKHDNGLENNDNYVVCPNCGLKLSHEIVVCPNDGTVLGKVADIQGKLSSQYEFIAEIGSGGMGVIYKARHVDLKQMVAVKMLHMTRLDEMSVRRFQQEARAVSALDHPSIVRVRDFGITESGQPHMVLDFIEGKTLAAAIEKSGALPLHEAIEIFVQICDAFDHAHSRGVLHRDLKPSNVMLVPKAVGAPLVKIVDFGIARIDDPENEAAKANLTRTGEVFGSPLYMSPEQAAGAPLDLRSDIYSLGCLMYETLTGTTPFIGGSSIEIIIRQLNEEAPPLKEGSLGKEFSQEIEQIVAKTLSKDPGDRYQTMNELKQALVKVTQGSAIGDGAGKWESDADETKKKFELKVLIISLVVLALLAVTSFILLSSSLMKPTVAPPPTAAVGPSVTEQTQTKLRAPEVDLSGMKITDKQLELFAEPTETTAVNLDSSEIEGPGLANLIHLRLKKLSLSHSKVNDRALEEVRNMTDLEDLDLSRTAVTDPGVAQLATLANLQKLNLSGDAIAGRTCMMIKTALPKLHELTVQNVGQLGEDACADIGQNKTLQKVDFSGSRIRDIDIKAMKVSKFSELLLDHTPITDQGLEWLKELPNLRRVSLGDCAVTKEAVEKLSRARPDLTITQVSTVKRQGS